MVESVVKRNALDFFEQNPKTWLKDYDDPLTQINELYNAGAKSVWVVDEYDNGFEFPDTLYIEVGKTIKTDLLIAVCNLRSDECSFSDDGKYIRIWWD